MPSEPATGQQLYHGETVAPVAAWKLVGAAILTIYVVQIGLYQAGLIEIAAAACSDVAVLVVLVLYAWRRRLSWKHFGVRRARGVYFVAAALIGLSAWYVNLWLVHVIQPPGETKDLERIVEQSSLVATLAAIALLPAVTEEVVFRGVLTRALASRFSAGLAIGLSAVAFALFHVLPAQMITTFGLGLALGYLSLRAGSAVPAMVAHLLNNAIALVVSRDAIPGVVSWMGDQPAVMLIGSSILLAGGLGLTARATQVPALPGRAAPRTRCGGI